MSNKIPSEYDFNQRPCTCGYAPVVRILKDTSSKNFADYYYVECDNCKKVGRAKSTIDEAIKKWNDFISSTHPIAGR